MRTLLESGSTRNVAVCAEVRVSHPNPNPTITCRRCAKDVTPDEVIVSGRLQAVPVALELVISGKPFLEATKQVPTGNDLKIVAW